MPSTHAPQRRLACTGLLALATTALGSTLTFASKTAWGQAAAPNSIGLRAMPHNAGSGTALSAQGQGERSAQRVVQQTLAALGSGMDRPPRALGGMLSKEDNEAMFSFAGHQRGQLVQGYGAVKISSNSYVVAVAMDAPARINQTGAALWAAAEGGGGDGNTAGAPSPSPSPYRNLQWAEQDFGSGRVNLPSGWRLVGQYKGAIDVVGPNGEGMSLGAAVPISTPQADRQLRSMGIANRLLVVPAMNDAVQAFRAVAPAMHRYTVANGGAAVSLNQVRETQAVPFPQMNAALIASDGTGNVGSGGSSGGRPYRKLSLVAIGAIMADGNWLYYHSEVYAPAEIYAHALPVMLKIWNSWSVDKSVLMERLISASQSLRETNDILRGIHANRMASQDRISANWGHYIRGTVVVANNDTGRQSTEWLYQPGPAANGVGTEHNRHMSDVVQGANQQAGYARWRMVNW